MLFDDGDYQSSETPAQKAKWRTKEKLWQAIRRAELWHPQVNDDEIPNATAEQVRVQAAHIGCRLTLHAIPSLVPLADRRCGKVACRDGTASKLDEW